MIEKLLLDLGERRYTLCIGTDLAREIRHTLSTLSAHSRSVVILTDEGLAAEQGDFLRALFEGKPQLVLPAGEKTKSLESLGRVYDFMAEHHIDRSGCLFAIGGGVIGDLGGFAAASYLRGIDYYQVPTTLLAMVDSSVGGKTGINIKAGKNLVGAFYQPKAVLVDTAFLQTLSPRQFSAGMAEVVKYGMLDDAGLFAKLQSLGRLHPTHPELPLIIRTCCAIKAKIVKADEQERALSEGRVLLNLGHTFAHAIETATAYGQYLHGEAVAIGLLSAARLSRQLGYLTNAEVKAVIDLISVYNLPVKLREPLSLSTLLEAMKHDKKVRGGKKRFVAMKKIGQAITVNALSEERIEQLWLEAGATR